MSYEDQITQEVIDRIADTPDPRTKAISEAVVRHLHALVRELRVTHAEWEAAIRFLTRTGHLCDDHRQEFILLSDALGVSMLVDAVNHGQDQAATESTVLGPFYVAGAPEFPLGADISVGMSGAPLLVSASVKSTDGAPLGDAQVDVWHSDEDGTYDVQHPDEGFYGRARLHSDADGQVRFWTKLPAAYPIPYDGTVGDMLVAQNRHPYRPAHVHFRIEAPGYRTLVTHIFAEGDSYLGSDAVFGVKPSLIRPFVERAAGTAPDGSRQASPWYEIAYDFVLAPAGP